MIEESYSHRTSLYSTCFLAPNLSFWKSDNRIPFDMNSSSTFYTSSAPIQAHELSSESSPGPERQSRLKTFHVSEDHLSSKNDRLRCGKDIIEAIRHDGIINISISGLCSPHVISNAFASQRKFFDMPTIEKISCFNEYTYGGYVHSGEEETAGKKDAAEIFTVLPDVPMDDWRVQRGIPGHGSMPWPFDEFETSMTTYMHTMKEIGTRLLRLIALGLGVDENAFDGLTENSWSLMRVLKYCKKSTCELNGTGSHTDYGMLVLIAQDRVGGLWVQPPGSAPKLESSEDANGWKFVVPEPNVLTCFPGDMLQFITDGQLVSTTHKVDLAHEERYSIAYFHEPSFGAMIRKQISGEKIHYGTYITDVFLRSYPEKPASKRIKSHNLLKNLPQSVTGTFFF